MAHGEIWSSESPCDPVGLPLTASAEYFMSDRDKVDLALEVLDSRLASRSGTSYADLLDEMMSHTGLHYPTVAAALARRRLAPFSVALLGIEPSEDR
jgi:hypothetical protein